MTKHILQPHGFPVDKISTVDETLSEILNIVVNSNSVGKNDISSTSFTKSTLKRMMSAIERLNASITSNRKDGIGMIKNKTAHNRYNPTPKSVFLTYSIPPFR